MPHEKIILVSNLQKKTVLSTDRVQTGDYHCVQRLSNSVVFRVLDSISITAVYRLSEL